MVRRLQNYRSLNIIPTKNSPIPINANNANSNLLALVHSVIDVLLNHIVV